MNTYAFFDVDETVVSAKTMFSFQEFWYERFGCDHESTEFSKDLAGRRALGASREELNRRYYSYFAGRKIADVRQAAEQWYGQIARDSLFHSNVVGRLAEHASHGEQPVFVSGSFAALLQPLAVRLGVSHILATDLVSVDGVYTGEIGAPQMIGPGKAWAVGDFLARTGGRAEDCYAYGDDISDRFMLAAVGHPTVVRGCEEMEVYARHRNWPIIDP